MLGAGLLAFSAVRDSANLYAKSVYPAGEKDHTSGNAITGGYEPGMDKSMQMVNRRKPNFPSAMSDNLHVESDATFSLTEEFAQNMLNNRAFMKNHAATFAEFHNEDHPLLDPDRQKWNYSSRKTEARFPGSDDDHYILGHRTGTI